jgi:hypothetical protein
LIPRRDHEVLFEGGAEQPHRADFGTSRPTGHEQQDRGVDVGAADHDRLVVTADRHLGELGHRGRVRVAVGRQDRVGARRPGDQHRQGDYRESGQRRRDPPCTPPDPARQLT